MRGKQNKRAMRQGYAGKVGLVVPNTFKGNSSYTKVAWVGEDNLSGVGRLIPSATLSWLLDKSDILLTK